MWLPARDLRLTHAAHVKKRLACAIMRGNARALTLALDPLDPNLEADAMEDELPREAEPL